MGKNINAPKPIKAFFNSFSQVVFVENIISGFLIMAAFFVWSYEVSNWHIGILAVVAAIVGNVTAKVLSIDDDTIASGLCGFCPVLVGAGAAVFYSVAGKDANGAIIVATGSQLMGAYIIAILGSILVVPLQLIINGLCGKLGLPGFTLPFIVMTWFLILVSQGSGLLTACGWMNGVPVAGGLVGVAAEGAAPAAAATFGSIDWVKALTLGLSEIYIMDTVIGSILIFLGFAIDNWKNAIKIALVIVATILLGIAFQVSGGTLNAGVFTYNAILVLMGMETFSKNKDNPARYWTLIVLGIVTVALVDYSLPSIVGTFGLSNLTFPFVLVTWGLLFLEQQLPEKWFAK